MHMGNHVCLCAMFAVIAGLVFAFTLKALLRTRICRPASGCDNRVARVWCVGDVDELSLVVWVRCGESEQPWVIDTGFAGPPVLSLPWTAVAPRGVFEDCQHGYNATIRALARSPPDPKSLDRALDRFLRECNASSFTAGCTTTLVGIGETRVSNSDMLLAPPLELMGHSNVFSSGRSCVGAPNADILSTTRMATASLITCDWLRQNGPCLISPSIGELRIGLDGPELLQLYSEFHPFANELSGGAFVTTLELGGQKFRLTVDTGSALTISLGVDAVERLKMCEKNEPMHIQQHGVNGERVCSSVVWSSTVIAGSVINTPVFLNDHPIDDVDGYIGLGLLQSFDMLITPSHMYICPTSDNDGARRELVEKARSGWCSLAPKCAKIGS